MRFWRKNQFPDMELGNLLFGHSRGKYPVPRDWRESAFQTFLKSCGFDETYGYCRTKDDPHIIRKPKDFGYENEVFILRPYYWGYSRRKSRRPNFVFKPTGYQIKWYKYPMRDAYANMRLTDDEFNDMLEQCIKSVKHLLRQAPNPEHSDMVDSVAYAAFAASKAI